MMGNIFKQKRGTAIGAKLAPPYNVVFMADVEEKTSNDLVELYGWHTFHWEDDEESLNILTDPANLFYPTIKITAEYCKVEVKSLDLYMKRLDGELKRDLFVKAANAHQFLDSFLSHPYHCKKRIPWSQDFRLDRICSYQNLDKHCNDLEKWNKVPTGKW